MNVDVDLMRKTLEYITAHPKEWSQGGWVRRGPDWDCGTACCLAGTVAVNMLKYKPLWDDRNDRHTATVLSPQGLERKVSDVARSALGLEWDMADSLFDANNNLRDLWEYGHYFSKGEIEIPAEVLAIEISQFDTSEWEY